MNCDYILSWNYLLLMSHLTKINTTIRDESLLKQTLSDLALDWKQLNDFDNSKSTYLISQSNNVDLRFIWNGQHYDLVTDVQFWKQSIPVELFLNKLSQRYAYNSIISRGQKIGFESIKEIHDIEGVMTITLRRWI